MAAEKTTRNSGDAWYAEYGPEQDVIVSTGSVLARNLANFPFSSILQDSDSERIQCIVFDAFHQLPDADEYNTVTVDMLDSTGKAIMTERGILPVSYSGKHSGIILRNDGKVACRINTDDHVHICSFASGMNVDSVAHSVYEIDSELQKYIQFAASHEFGYLTSSIFNCGSGLTLSARLHLPSLTLLGSINELIQNKDYSRWNFMSSFGPGSAGGSLGSYYTVSSASSASGTEFDQSAEFCCLLQDIVKKEKAARKNAVACKKTEIADKAYRALAVANAALFVSQKEAVEIIGNVKNGIDCQVLSGVEQNVLHALLYRIQEGHLEYVLTTGNFKFEKDISNDRDKKINRLRALILQEAFEEVYK